MWRSCVCIIGCVTTPFCPGARSCVCFFCATRAWIAASAAFFCSSALSRGLKLRLQTWVYLSVLIWTLRPQWGQRTRHLAATLQGASREFSADVILSVPSGVVSPPSATSSVLASVATDILLLIERKIYRRMRHEFFISLAWLPRSSPARARSRRRLRENGLSMQKLRARWLRRKLLLPPRTPKRPWTT